MDVQLKELIEKIKNEGVRNAEEQSEEIISNAEKRADEIVKKAQEDAQRIIESAEKEAEKIKTTGKEALKQAGRDMLLGLKEKIERVFRSVVVEESGKALRGKNLETAITKVVGSMKPDEIQDMNVLLDKTDLDEIEKGLRAALSDKLKSGLELKPVETSMSGFHITEKDGSAYFNYTDEGIAEVLCEYLNPRLSDILKEAVRED